MIVEKWNDGELFETPRGELEIRVANGNLGVEMN